MVLSFSSSLATLCSFWLGARGLEVLAKDAAVREVWLCSGQSNMEMGIKAARDAEKEMAAADHPEIRLLLVAQKWSPIRLSNMAGEWRR